MNLVSTSIADGAPIDAAFAMGGPDGFAGNRSPHLAWDDVPAAARSFVVACLDPDAPANPAGAGEPGKVVEYDRARTDFVHWVLYDVPADVREIAEGDDSDGITPRGKAADRAPVGVRGRNDYTMWFATDPDLAGTYHGYDGPYPPPNDERVHRYRFVVHALDVDTLGLDAGASWSDVAGAMEGHVLASAALTGTYALNPDARP